MNIVVLAGGISTERDVSLISGSMIYKALKANGHRAIILDVYLGYEGDTTGIFDLEKDWSKEISSISEMNPDVSAIKAMRPDGDKNYFGPNVIALCQEADAVFLALHGVGGEDGKVQAVFDLMGIRYTGTGFTSAAMAMDKAITKDLFVANGIPTPKGIVLTVSEDAKAAIGKVPYPCIIKARNGGSSVGVTIATNDAEFLEGCRIAFTYDTVAVVEEYIKGREFSVAVLDGKALPVIEIAPKQGFYDYKNKYQSGNTVETCPADLPAEWSERMQKHAEAAFRALRYQSYARMDFMMRENGEMFCLEANTLPGMTPTSLLPQEAAAVGMDFNTLCETILQTAFREKE